MNKTTGIILIILLSILTVIVTVTFILLMKGKININWLHFSFDTYSKNLIDSKEFNSLEDIDIITDTGDVFFEEGLNDKVTVELYSEDSDDYYIKEEDNIIKIKLNTKKTNHVFFVKTNRIIVKVPSSYDKKVNVDFHTGDVIVNSFANMKLNATGTTGDIKANRIDTLDFELKTGDIKIDEVNYISGKLTTGDIKIGNVNEFSAAATTGDITINRINKRVYAKTSTGDIKIEKATIEEDSSITTGTGDVKISSLEGAYIDANTNTGDIKIKNNDRKLEKEIKISTTTGDIKVN